MSDYSAIEITNLLYRYAELIDRGNLEAAAALFNNARIKIQNSTTLLNACELLTLWKQHLLIYPCGTPRTNHLITNPIIELDGSGLRATCRSCYTVYQATEDFPLQPIASGRYHDEFEQKDGVWRFSFRDYSLLDFPGDMRFHLKRPE